MKNLKLTNFEDFKKNYMNDYDREKVFRYFYQYNNCFGLITNEDFQDCRQAEYLEMARSYSAVLSTVMLMWTLDNTLLRRRTLKPAALLFKYGVAPAISFQITKSYFCRDIEQIFHDMAHKYQFSMDQYHKAMEMMSRAHKHDRLNEFLEKGLEFDWTTIKE